MVDLSNTALPIKHSTQSLPGVLRDEIYTLDDLVLTEHYDDATGEFYVGDVTARGVKVATITASGILVDVPMFGVTDHAAMERHIQDLQRLDQFLSAVYKNYQQA